MKKIVILLSFLACFLNNYGQSKIILSQSITSELLNTNVKYSVYLPNGYSTSKRTYPVVYLLNGFTGDETDWIIKGRVKEITDGLIKAKRIRPMIIIMPDGDDRLYMNKDDGTYPYEDMFITEFIPQIEQTYRIKNDKKHRAISGLSMGGSGSLRLALKYHNLFNTCSAFSSGISTDEEIFTEPQNNYDVYFGIISPSSIGKKGSERFTDALKDYDVLRLVNSKDSELLKTVNIYFDCGDDDFLTIGNSQLHIDLTKKGVPHEFRMRNGGHSWDFWQESLPHGLEFISNALHK